jgi:hypothetical protein
VCGSLIVVDIGLSSFAMAFSDRPKSALPPLSQKLCRRLFLQRATVTAVARPANRHTMATL